MTRAQGFVLGPMVPKTHKTGRVAKRYHVDGHGNLTAEQIAELGRIHPNTVYRRIKAGISGSALLSPAGAYNNRKGRVAGPTFMDEIRASGNVPMTIAVRLAKTFRDSVPTIAWLRKHMGMSRATAYRWRRAWIECEEMEGARRG